MWDEMKFGDLRFKLPVGSQALQLCNSADPLGQTLKHRLLLLLILRDFHFGFKIFKDGHDHHVEALEWHWFLLCWLWFDSLDVCVQLFTCQVVNESECVSSSFLGKEAVDLIVELFESLLISLKFFAALRELLFEFRDDIRDIFFWCLCRCDLHWML